MTSRIALDIHAHLIPVSPERLDKIPGVEWDACEEKMEIDGHVIGIKSLFQPLKFLNWMSAQNVARAWISSPPPTYRQHLRGAEAEAWCSYLNEGLAEIAFDSECLTALPHLPTQDPDLARDIAGHWASRGIKVFSMPTGTGDDRGLSDPGFAPLWAELNRIGAGIFFHPGSCADGRLEAFYLGNILGNPHETSVAISHMVLGGILEAYPRITPCFAHGGGTYPMISGRVQRGADTNRPGLNQDAIPPAELLPRIYVDSICHGEAQLALAEQTFGERNVLFGSDWPFPMGLIEPHDQMSEVGSKRKTRIFETNAEHILKHLNRED